MQSSIELPSFVKLPKHVAFILDGNGRWAQQRDLPRSEGHRAGGETLDILLDFVRKIGIPNFSLYAFSTENWKRPVDEIRSLWKLLEEFFTQRLERCHHLGIRVIVSGDTSKLPKSVRTIIEEVVEKTKGYKSLKANFCINYGSHDEILRACNLILKSRLTANEKLRKKKVTLKEIEKNLYTADLPPVDLLIRTGGEKRLSNFMLWQVAYAEIFITDTLFPDFHLSELINILNWYQERHRRFGALK